MTIIKSVCVVLVILCASLDANSRTRAKTHPDVFDETARIVHVMHPEFANLTRSYDLQLLVLPEGMSRRRVHVDVIPCVPSTPIPPGERYDAVHRCGSTPNGKTLAKLYLTFDKASLQLLTYQEGFDSALPGACSSEPLKSKLWNLFIAGPWDKVLQSSVEMIGPISKPSGEDWRDGWRISIEGERRYWRRTIQVSKAKYRVVANLNECTIDLYRDQEPKK